jgi:hypothetical protein
MFNCAGTHVGPVELHFDSGTLSPSREVNDIVAAPAGHIQYPQRTFGDRVRSCLNNRPQDARAASGSVDTMESPKRSDEAIGMDGGIIHKFFFDRSLV